MLIIALLICCPEQEKPIIIGAVLGGAFWLLICYIKEDIIDEYFVPLPSEAAKIGDIIQFEFMPHAFTEGKIIEIIKGEEKLFKVYSESHGEFTITAKNIDKNNH